ncbi:protein IQ-DOMAIN 31-like isoform X2 [Silene latifolia]|uniref:protein IQ-DOMAIN 31-like isoform X2 n=1 Tax=Silene latifolia TaxID=37657 RepID=UPI003D786610
MGKSPGKWIKTKFFGKKTSKSKYSAGKEKPANEKDVHVQAMSPETGIDDNHQEVVSAVQVDEQNSCSENREMSFIQQDHEISELGDQNAEVEQRRELDMLSDAERIAQEKAATTVQAAFRSYLARRAFKALKGIIRLQALIRGHLVRRQAVATLYCVIGIVKLQALVRGSKIRCSDVGIEVQRLCVVKPLDVANGLHENGVSTSTASFLTNAFIKKLLAPTPEGMPLRVQYDETDSNSVQIWLERWSISCPWKPVSPPKKATNTKTQKKLGNSQAVEGETVRPKRSVRKVPSIFDNPSAQSTSELEKPRRNPKKVSSHPVDSVQENPQNEFEKVKRSLRKVHSPVTETSAQSEVPERPPQSQAKSEVTERPSQNQAKSEVTERPSQSQTKSEVAERPSQSQTKSEVAERPSQSQAKMTPIVQDVTDPNEVNPVENMKEATTIILKEEAITAPKEIDQETTKVPIENNQSREISVDDVIKVKSESLEGDEKDENTPVSNGELKSTEESIPSDNQKPSRRASFPAKQEHADDGLQNTPKLPSYMQATQSAKAKLRAQGSPKLGQESAEKNNVIRRQSLPSPANGKVSSVSPRTPKPVQVNGKGGNKSDKSLLSSKEGNGKATQGWRR